MSLAPVTEIGVGLVQNFSHMFDIVMENLTFLTLPLEKFFCHGLCGPGDLGDLSLEQLATPSTASASEETPADDSIGSPTAGADTKSRNSRTPVLRLDLINSVLEDPGLYGEDLLCLIFSLGLLEDSRPSINEIVFSLSLNNTVFDFGGDNTDRVCSGVVFTDRSIEDGASNWNPSIYFGERGMGSKNIFQI